jgi:hypothetical protein
LKWTVTCSLMAAFLPKMDGSGPPADSKPAGGLFTYARQTRRANPTIFPSSGFRKRILRTTR